MPAEAMVATPADPKSPAAALDAPGLPPPPPAWPTAPLVEPQQNDAAAVEELQRRITTTREQLNAVQVLLEDMPAIFEQRFLGRLEPLLEQRRVLLSETGDLRSHLLELQRSGRALRALERTPAPAAPSLRQRPLGALGRPDTSAGEERQAA